MTLHTLPYLALDRQEGLFNPSAFRDIRACFVGIGGVGSTSLVRAACLGMPNIEAYDPDMVAPHNIHNQEYCLVDIDQPKVHAIQRVVREKTGREDVKAFLTSVDARTAETLSGVIFLCPDKNNVRRQVVPILRNSRVRLVVDLRMDASHIMAFTCAFSDPEVASTHWDIWNRNTPPDEELQHQMAACGSPASVGITASYVANIGLWFFVRWCARFLEGRKNVKPPPCFYTKDLYTGHEYGIDWYGKCEFRNDIDDDI